MAGTKISALGSLSVLADGTVVPVVDSGTNYKLAATAIRDYVLAGLVTATNFAATSNGLGTSFKVGDDAWIGDVNLANGFRVTGIEDPTQGYVVFGNANNTVYIGRSGSGPITVTGNFAVTGTTTLATSLSGLIKTTSGVVSAASAGTDYLAPPSGTSLLKANNGGALANASAGTDYAAPNQTMYLGTTAVAINRASATGLSLAGVSIDGSAGSVAAANLTGTTLASGVTGSSLTSVGTLGSLTVSGATSLQTTTTVKDVRDTIYTGGTTTGTITPDAANGNIQTLTLTGSITLNAFANPVSGQSMTLIITQPSSGGPYTLTSTMKFANGAKTLSTAANAVDMLTISYIGTTYYASLITGFA